jgi:hypothetical protein
MMPASCSPSRFATSSSGWVKTGLYSSKWTDQILDEWLPRTYPDAAAALARQREQMRAAIRDVDVRGYANLIPAVPALPDPNDAHVVAATMASKAEVIVTFNLSHFPAKVLGALDRCSPLTCRSMLCAEPIAIASEASRRKKLPSRGGLWSVEWLEGMWRPTQVFTTSRM